MDAIALAHRIRTRIAEREAAGEKVPAFIKRYLRQAPKHAYRNDTLQKIAQGLGWSVAELVEGVWRDGEDVAIYGLERHQVCLRFARRLRAAAGLDQPNPLGVPIANALDALELEDLVAQLYAIWRDMERDADNKPIDARIITAFWQREFRAILEPGAATTLEPPFKIAS